MVDLETQKLLANEGATSNKDEDFRVTDAQFELEDAATAANKLCWAIPLNTSLVSLPDLWERLKGTKLQDIDN